MENSIVMFKDRQPSLPSRWYGVELQFYVRYPQDDVIETVDGEEVIKEYAYIVYLLPWRKEFNQGAEYDDKGEFLRQDYVTEHFEELLEESKQI